MAAYGKIRGVQKPLGNPPARLYPILDSNVSDSKAAIVTVAIDFAAGGTIDDQLSQNLRNDFNEELEAGRTYPQEDTLDEAGYAAYFKTYDLILGFHITRAQLHALLPSSSSPSSSTKIPENGIPLPQSTTFSTIKPAHPPTTDEEKIGGGEGITLALPQTYAFAYYIKPNYPGRSSHLCNAGFIVPPPSRGQGLGRIAARSFCYYGPACGYRGSVFNLVYVNNEASVKLWERLGFRNVGRIPEAGRLKKAGGSGEEFVDAWVVYGDFRVVGVRD